MLSNLSALKIVSTLTMFINSQRRFMGSSKPQEYGMNAYEISLSLIVGVSNPGVPGPTSKLSPRAPAQMGRRETEHEGGKKSEGDGRER
jgi:hypothetical protein